MRLNKTVKALAVSLPMLALAACSSSDSTVDEQAQIEANAKAAEQAKAAEAEKVRIEALKQQEAIEAKKKEMEELLANHIIYFGFDQSTLSGTYSQVLDAHAKFLSQNTDKNVLIEGHADERGTPEYNIALGERRAKAVANYLENMGVSSSQISIVSYGEEKPLAKDRSEAAFAKNRRAVLVY